MQNLNFSHSICQNNLICIGFSLSKNDCFSIQTFVTEQNVAKSWGLILVRTVDSQMLNCWTCLVFEVFDQIVEDMFLKMNFSNFSDPRWYCCWKENELWRLSFFLILWFLDCFHDFLNIFLESLVEHLVSFVENDSLKLLEINVLPFNMIEHSACCSYKELNSIFKLPDLVLNWHSSVNCDHIKLFLVVSDLL